MSTITVNGEPREIASLTVRDLLCHEGFDPDRRGLAVAVNGAVVPRKQWNETSVHAGDDVEVVKPFSGG